MTKTNSQMVIKFMEIFLIKKKIPVVDFSHEMMNKIIENKENLLGNVDSELLCAPAIGRPLMNVVTLVPPLQGVSVAPDRSPPG